MRFLLMISVLVMVSGCATTYRSDLRQPDTNYLQQTRIIADLSAPDLDAQFEQQQNQVVGAGALGALVGALVDAGVNAYNANSAEQTILQLREKLGPDALHRAYKHQYHILLDNIPDLTGRPMTVWKETPKKGIRGIGLQPGEIAILLSPEYSLTISKRHLHVVLEASLYQGKANGKRPELLYQNRFLYQSPAIPMVNNMRDEEEIAKAKAALNAKFTPLPKDKRKRIIARNKLQKKLKALEAPLSGHELAMRQAAVWLKNDAHLLRTYFKEGVADIFAMFAHDYAFIAEDKPFTPRRSITHQHGRIWQNLSHGQLAGSWVSGMNTETIELSAPQGGTIFLAPTI